MSLKQVNFDAMTMCGIAAGMLLLAVIGIGIGKDVAVVIQQGSDDANSQETVDRDGSETSQPAVGDRGQGQDQGGSQAGGVAAGQLQPCSGDAAPAGRAEDSRRRIVRMRVTAYCPCKICCGPKAHGVTASGKPVAANGGRFVAADRPIPFGTLITVPGYANGQPVPVLDRGGAIKGNRLDVYFPTHRQALAWGVKYLDVEVRR